MMSREPKPEDVPDHLFSPIADHDTVRDGFRARKHSASNWVTRRVSR